MAEDPETRVSKDTRRLLFELDRAVDQSSTLRALAGRRELLYQLESLTGPSPKTRTLRQEISRMEQLLRDET